MLLKRLLLKIETGQILTKKQEKSLANKLYLITPLSRMITYTLMGILMLVLLIIGFSGGHYPVYDWLAFLLVGLLILVFLFLLIVPKHVNIKKYLSSVEKFYKTKLKDYENYEVLYVGQHVNPHIRVLRSPKIYILTDGYHFLFINDYFKDTEYPLQIGRASCRERV